MEPDFQEQVLEIVKTIPGENENASKRLIVKVDLSTFLAQIQSMGLWKGSSACLVTTGGYYLAHTDHSMHDTIALGESGDPLEKSVLKAMKNLGYGTLFGTGYPPDLVISFYQVPSTEWYVVIFSKGGIILEPIIRFAVYSVLGIIGFVGAIFLMIRSTTGSVARSVEHLSSLAARVAGGDYSERLPARQSDEIGHLNGRVNEMMEALKQRDLIQSTFGRYIDPEIAAELLNNPESLYMGGEEKVVTIMMADLIGFEEMADKTQPEEVIAILNEYLSAMIEVISFYKGIIIDFFGAGILVFFNGITANPKERAADAVKCALEMRNRFQTLRGRDGARQLQMLGIVTGIHTGAVIVGNIGAETRTKYGIVGSAVNLTQRIKSSGATGTILISEETYQMLGQRVSVGGRTSAQLKGVEHPKTIYMVESIDNQS
ncbi:MAG: HAMP domain-containing protein [Desulfomonile tiedjei]|uniref:HAMP domain-containing protein n=1 Tax=Desulfomonile tiedjei TaxID=2358 RepID=A0A9D6V696_9BACT|nr:HAMP domain-containing protein [Desulfomonile tiedjei]